MIKRWLSPAKEYYDDKLAQCELSEVDLKVKGNATIKMYVIRPKNLPKYGNACEIWAHGGGAIMLDAATFNGK